MLCLNLKRKIAFTFDISAESHCCCWLRVLEEIYWCCLLEQIMRLAWNVVCDVLMCTNGGGRFSVKSCLAQDRERLAAKTMAST